jgi:flavin reductase (DIM6/NTAB) family NADH-FMN oxidoreductase RutF/pimeloyl-ACP methyl ester carboxylesterase
VTTRYFDGFGGVRLMATEYGMHGDPSVLMLPGAGQDRSVWDAAARMLADAGRHAVCVDLRGQGDSAAPRDGRYDLDAHVGDLRSILKSLSARPVVIGAGFGGWIATLALGEGEPDLASGLVLVDAPARPDEASLARIAALPSITAIDPDRTASRIEAATARLKVPSLFVRGAMEAAAGSQEMQDLARSVAGAELIEIDADGREDNADRADTFNAALIEFLERRVPRDPPEFIAGSDPRTLRDALGCFATGITVVTTRDADGRAVGLTANSFTSVSLDPPLLLVCPARTSSSMPALNAASHFAVNVLHIGQQPVSNVFASKVEDRFADLDWETWDHDVPIIRDSLASFECEKYAEHDGGDHVILLGKVTRVRFEPQRDPLLYFRGKYRRLHFA